MLGRGELLRMGVQLAGDELRGIVNIGRREGDVDVVRNNLRVTDGIKDLWK